MPEQDYSLEQDLSQAREMAESLEDYLSQDNLYGTVNGLYATTPDMPSLTIGALLLRIHRLRAQENRMSAAQKATLTEIETLHEDARQKHGGRYHKRMVDEAAARLRSLEAFFAECEDDPQTCAEAYLPEALRRTIAEDIVRALRKYHLPLLDLDNSLRSHDMQLRRFTSPSAFIWSSELQPVYPEESYWWLYARPKVEANANR